MSVVAPKLFQSTDTGAPVLSGTVGAFLEVLASCLILRKCYTAVSSASFVDNTTEARGQGGSSFSLFQGPTVTTNEAYFGLCRPFERLALTFGTAGVQGSAVTLAWEYWNGSAWTALTVTDGTSGLTVSGAVTFTPPGAWATTTVNAQAAYWVRLRYTAGTWSTNPLVSSCTLVGWSIAFSGTNGADFQMGGGNQFYLDVNDNAPGTAAGARLRGYETMSAYQTGLDPFPTVTQVAIGLAARKSATANATARAWVVVADDRTVYVQMNPGDGGGYTGCGFGDFYSFTQNDPYRVFIMGRTTEAAVTGVDPDPFYRHDFYDGASNNVAAQISFAGGKYAARSYTANVGAALVAMIGDISKKVIPNTDGYIGMQGTLSYPNPADGGVHVAPMLVHEWGGSGQGRGGGILRGRMRGYWHWLHNYAAVPDRASLTGTGAMAARAFLVVTPGCPATNGGVGTAGCLETSDTWETN